MRIAITAGGTGGHIFPAVSVFEALRQLDPSVEARFFGPENRGERAMVAATGLPFEVVPSAAIRGRGPIGLVRSAWSLARGVFAALRKFRAFRPDAVFSTGGYASFPGAVAARLLRRPLVVYLPDVSPGWAVRAEARLATRMATTAEAALALLPRTKTRVTGYPVRETFFTVSRAEARERLGIPPGDLVVLVAGASQGARAINQALFSGLGDLLRRAHVLHVTGAAGLADAEAVAAGLEPALREHYRPAAFRDDLPVAMLAADLAVMRAGASILGELPAAGLPAVLVPGTFAGAHQKDNAKWLESAGAAIVLEESSIDRLGGLLGELVDDPERLQAMAASARALVRPEAARDIARLIEEVASR